MGKVDADELIRLREAYASGVFSSSASDEFRRLPRLCMEGGHVMPGGSDAAGDDGLCRLCGEQDGFSCT